MILTDIPIENQKITGRLKDDLTLEQNKVVNGSKLMVIGSTLKALESVLNPPSTKPDNSPTLPEKKEPLCKRAVGVPYHHYHLPSIRHTFKLILRMKIPLTH